MLNPSPCQTHMATMAGIASLGSESQVNPSPMPGIIRRSVFVTPYSGW